MIKKELNYLSKGTRDYIQNDTYEEILTGIKQAHSLQTIVSEGREIAVGARMTSRPIKWNQFALNNNQSITLSTSKKYSGKDIADIFVNSVLKYGKSYYPLSGDWRNVGIKQLVLFVKDNSQNKYLPYARFDISDILTCSSMTSNQLQHLTDITPVCYSQFKTILEITAVQTNNLPSDYLGNNSALPIYEVAFKGPSPNVLII